MERRAVIPEKIYKFHRIDFNLVKCLTRGQNWYSKVKYLNDPNELLFINNSGTEVYNGFREAVALCCFTENMDNVLLWSHYAASHTGCCLEFSDIRQDGRFISVKYTDKISTIDSVKYNEQGGYKINAYESTGSFLTRKLECWRYENEIRTYMLISGNAIPGIYGDYPGQLSAIYFGKNCSEDDMNAIKSIAGDAIDYHKVDLCTNEFKMKVKH